MTGAMSRRRGKVSEQMVCSWLRANGHPSAKRRLAGNGQMGDIDGVPGLVIEVKGVRQSSWPTWCRQAHLEAQGTPWVVVRRAELSADVASWQCVAVCTAVPDLPVAHPVSPRVALPQSWREDRFVACVIPGLPLLYAGRFGHLFDTVEEPAAL